ncbi:conserved hypothetical protein [Thermotomaculum hydrothermale]|uniref:DUF4870 domain-containing protein n=1 Tax=Thermotomaculum hydrothermale TaxID=981385 RepID=A0A7R6PS75_9BACT|nr:DUF4870 domain-containing protein [Thermotomaculum hydrothermale]BBB31662.1 conserved hypothetical protein [Thermotomaculum hydrothermale]
MELILTFNEMEGNSQTPPPPPPQPEQTPPPPPTEPQGGEPQNTGDVNVLMAILSYFGIFALIPLFVEKEDEFIQFHAKQGTTLLIAEIVLSIAFFIIGLIPILGCIVAVAEMLIFLALFVFHIIMMIKASKGEWYKIPYVYDWSLKIFK